MRKLILTCGIIIASTLAITAYAQVEEFATSTPEISVSKSVESIPTDTSSEVSVETVVISEESKVEEIETATTTTIATPVETEVDTFGPVHSVALLEESYFVNHNKYLQILPDNQLPDYESGTVAEKLGSTIPANMRVDVYESPAGHGYQISYEENGTSYSFGYGPEFESRTTARPIISNVSSSSAQ